MKLLLLILAIMGFGAALRLAGRGAFRLMRGGVDAFLAAEVSDAHARRGDITALQAAETARSLAQRTRLGAILVLAASAGLLIAPWLTPWPTLLYACYAPLWLLVRRRA